MRTGNKRVVGTLLAVTLGVTSTAVLSGPAEAVGKPARIKGVVTTAGGQALAGIRVATLAEMTVGGVEQWVEVDSAETGTDGRYSVGKLDDGTYRVRFDDTAGRYSTEFYNDQVHIDLAEDVVLVPGGGMRELSPTELGAAAHLTGAVTGTTGSGIAGAEVTAYVVHDGTRTPFATDTTDADGRYDVDGLPGGTYTLGFRDPATEVSEFWNDKATLAEADTLVVKSAGSSTGLDARLATPVPAPEPATDPEPSPGSTTTPSTDPTPSATAAPTQQTAPTPVATTAPTTTTAKVVMVKRPRIKGTAAVTQVLRVTRGTWNPTKVSRKIQWLANGKRIKGATKNRLRVTKKLVGKRITVRVVASAPERAALTVKTRRTKKVRG
ncbi:MAG TPA: carboxypeptidase regulatory-like domain-containing protein [Nocardioides sp.]|nr:carboxypeptidase regulatory-like domain-containing protein [Nocardioides sp.]